MKLTERTQSPRERRPSLWSYPRTLPVSVSDFHNLGLKSALKVPLECLTGAMAMAHSGVLQTAKGIVDRSKIRNQLALCGSMTKEQGPSESVLPLRLSMSFQLDCLVGDFPQTLQASPRHPHHNFHPPHVSEETHATETGWYWCSERQALEYL